MSQDRDGIRGIHHVTALARDAQVNLDFYTEVLGLRLVKTTVNFDDPATYHLYYGDELGRPGTILTFFPWPRAMQGAPGAGQATVTAFRMPTESLGYWKERLERLDVRVAGVATRFGAEVLTLLDPDGLRLELVATEDAERDTPFRPWRGAPVPAPHALRGFHGVTLAESRVEATARFLSDVMDFELTDEEGGRLRFQAGSDAEAAAVEIVPAPGPGRIGAGSVHHIAWRVAGDEEQAAWRARLSGRGATVTPVRDRHYFRSIYFHEPGGVLFEIATDLPGFTLDEPAERLGAELRLPGWLEPQRARIEATLRSLRRPAPTSLG